MKVNEIVEKIHTELGMTLITITVDTGKGAVMSWGDFSLCLQGNS